MTDTLTCDTTLLMQFRSDEAFNYGKELQGPQKSLLEWIGDVIAGFIDEIIGNTFGNDSLRPLFACVAVVLFVLVIYLIYRYKPGLFGFEGRTSMEYTVTEDTIYGIDFDAEIARALAIGNYNEAVRMVYLQTLRWLSDNNKINWQIYKTPTQYLRELDMPQFRKLTNTFVRVRYGNYAATADTVSSMQVLQRAVEEGGGA